MSIVGALDACAIITSWHFIFACCLSCPYVFDASKDDVVDALFCKSLAGSHRAVAGFCVGVADFQFSAGRFACPCAILADVDGAADGSALFIAIGANWRGLFACKRSVVADSQSLLAAFGAVICGVFIAG